MDFKVLGRILSACFGLSQWTHVFRDWPLLVFILNHVFAKHGRSWSKSCTLHLWPLSPLPLPRHPTFTTQQFGAGSDRAYSGIYARCFLASLGNRARD